MRITIVLGPFLSPPPAPAGAVEKRWSRKARIFAQRGHQVAVVCRDHPDLPAEEFRDGVRWIRIKGYDRGRSIYHDLLRDLPYSLRARRVLPDADLLVTNCFWLPVLLPGRGPKGALDVHVARVPKGQMWMYRHAARISTVSRHVAARIAKEVPSAADRIRFINNPVDSEVFHPDEAPGDARTICYTGRIHPEKGVHLLAAAVRRLRRHDPRWRLRAFGELATERGGGGESYRERIVAEAGDADAIELPGNIREEAVLAAAIRSCRYFVYPSLAKEGEAFGISPLEAMAVGVPPIVSELEVFRDFIEDGRTGVVVPCLDPGCEDRLAKAIASLDDDPVRYQMMRSACVEAAADFDYDAVASRYLQDFQHIVEGPPIEPAAGPLRINIVLGPFLPPPPALSGAVEKVWWHLARSFVTQGHLVSVICREHPDLPADPAPGDPRRIDLPGECRSGWIQIDLLRDIRYSRRAAAILPPADITVTNCFWLPVILGRRPGPFGAVNVHVQRFPKRQMWLYRHAARLSTVSQAIADAIARQQGSLASKVRVIGNPIDLEIFRPPATPPSNPDAVVVFTGRIHPEKGLDLLVDAWCRVRRRHPGTILRLIGPTEVAIGGGGAAYLLRLRQLAGDAPLEIHGPIADAAQLAAAIAKADIYAYPSVAFYGEASPVAPLEAMAVGVPPVVSDLPQFASYIVPGETGLTFRRGATDPAGDLAAALMRLIDDPQERARIRANAIRMASRFSTDTIASAYLEDFRRIVARHRGGHT
jgi:glycosyltransferase involved in cell wall biosynthesis